MPHSALLEQTALQLTTLMPPTAGVGLGLGVTAGVGDGLVDGDGLGLVPGCVATAIWKAAI